MRILALGDSYTTGEGVRAEERWPVQLARLLQEAGLAAAEPEMVARTGWTAGELQTAIGEAALSPPYELVTLLVGVNNQYRGYPQDEYRGQFAVMLQAAIGYAGGRAGSVLVLSIPDWGATPYAAGRDRERIASEIDAFNRINREETALAGARYLDVTPDSRRAAVEPDLLAADGLHPSGKMYAGWAQLALPLVMDMCADE
jgi:lysophospholipase L1-like esterase